MPFNGIYHRGVVVDLLQAGSTNPECSQCANRQAVKAKQSKEKQAITCYQSSAKTQTKDKGTFTG